MEQVSILSDKTTSSEEKDPDLKGFKLTGHNLLVKPIHVEAKTKSGIIISDQTADDASYLMNVCKVLLVGPTAYTQDMFKETGPWANVGDYVMIPKLTGTKLNYKGTILTIVSCDKVIATVEDPKSVDPHFNLFN